VLTCFQAKKADRQSLREVRRGRRSSLHNVRLGRLGSLTLEDSKLSSAWVFFVGNYFVTFFIIGLIAAGISLLKKPKPLRISEVAEAFLSYHLLFAIGINNLINFVFHVFFGDVAAKFIGWENSPFQAEVGFASLGVGIAGVLAFKASLPFRFATLIPPSAFSWAVTSIR
jgi:hypothetical protein